MKEGGEGCVEGGRLHVDEGNRYAMDREQVSETMKDRRGRRLDLSCRLFFFGQDDFEGEATLLDVSTMSQ